MQEVELKPCPFCGGQMEPEVMCFQHPNDQSYLDWLKVNNILPPIMTGFNDGYVQLMISCRKNYCELLENTMFEIQNNDPNHVVIKEITKEMCGQ